MFDVDGTLVDSERYGHRIAFNDAFEEEGLPYRWSEQEYGELLKITGGARRLRHYLLGQGFPRSDAETLAERLHRRKTEVFAVRCQEGLVPPRPGVARLLDELSDAGVTIAIATTGTRAWVEPLLDRLFGLKHFAALVTGTEIPKLKPNPGVYHEVLRQLGLSPVHAVAVEDSANGLQAAHSARLACLVVVNGYTHEDDCYGAELVIDSFGNPGCAHVLQGAQNALDNEAVTARTLGEVLQARWANAH